MDNNKTLSIIALVSMIAIVGMVVAFAVSSRASAPAAATPVYVSAPANTEETTNPLANAAGKMMEAELEGTWCTACGSGPGAYKICCDAIGGGAYNCYNSAC